MNQLDQGAVDVTIINAFNSKLDRLRTTKVGFFMDYSAEPYYRPSDGIAFAAGDSAHCE